MDALVGGTRRGRACLPDGNVARSSRFGKEPRSILTPFDSNWNLAEAATPSVAET